MIISMLGAWEELSFVLNVYVCVHTGPNEMGMNTFRGQPHPPQSPSWPECGMGMEGPPNANRLKLLSVSHIQRYGLVTAFIMKAGLVNWTQPTDLKLQMTNLPSTTLKTTF